MLGCRMAMSSKGVMQRLEMSVDRQLLAGIVARAVRVTMLTEVGDVCAGGRHEAADSGMVARCSTRNPMTATLKSTRCGNHEACFILQFFLD